MARELSPSEEVAYSRYLGFGTPDEVAKIVADNARLKSENADRRQKVTELEGELVKAKPPEGAVVLTGDETTEYTAFKALGIKAADVEALKTTNETLAADKRTRDRKDLLRAARETEGWNEQAPDVLQNTTGFDALELTEGEVTRERVGAGGKKESVKLKTAFATVDGKQVPVADVVNERWAYLKPVLAAGTTNGGGTDGRAVPEQRGIAGAPGQKTQEDHAKAVRSKIDYTV